MSQEEKSSDKPAEENLLGEKFLQELGPYLRTGEFRESLDYACKTAAKKGNKTVEQALCNLEGIDKLHQIRQFIDDIWENFYVKLGSHSVYTAMLKDPFERLRKLREVMDMGAILERFQKAEGHYKLQETPAELVFQYPDGTSEAYPLELTKEQKTGIFSALKDWARSLELPPKIYGKNDEDTEESAEEGMEEESDEDMSEKEKAQKLLENFSETELKILRQLNQHGSELDDETREAYAEEVRLNAIRLQDPEEAQQEIVALAPTFIGNHPKLLEMFTDVGAEVARIKTQSPGENADGKIKAIIEGNGEAFMNYIRGEIDPNGNAKDLFEILSEEEQAEILNLALRFGLLE